MCRGCLSSLKYSLICVSERWRPNQVFHQNKKGISTISQATRKKRKRFRADMWRRDVASCEDGNQQCHGKQETLPLVPFCHHGLKDRSRVLLSFAPSVTFWSRSPSFSCTKARVYSPGGRPLISNLPSGPVTA